MLRREWITAGHGELWNCRGTYCAVPFEYLPKVNQATHDLGWLDQVSPRLRDVISDTSTLNADEKKIANLKTIIEKAQALALELPEPFLRFMQSAELQAKVPTCTACYLELSTDFVLIPGVKDQYLLRFMNDSQSCALWYLYFDRNETAAKVVVSSYFLDPDIFKEMEYEEINYEDIFAEAAICADTFTEFIYRFWIENTIWYSLSKRVPATPLQEEYRNHITKRL